MENFAEEFGLYRACATDQWEEQVALRATDWWQQQIRGSTCHQSFGGRTISLNMAEGSDTPASLPDYILDEVPPLHEIVEYARTDCCIELGTMLELDIEDLRNVKKTESSVSAELSAVYQMWLDKKGRDATRRRLLAALRTKHVGQNRIAESYEAVLIKMVSRFRTCGSVNSLVISLGRRKRRH